MASKKENTRTPESSPDIKPKENTNTRGGYQSDSTTHRNESDRKAARPRSTDDALEMISKHEEVRAMILECLQGIDSTVKDIQMEVQLQDFIATPTPARRDARADADLNVACRKGNLAEVKRILDTGRADVNCRDEVGRTPVMMAADGGHSDVVELLVSRGADLSLVTDGGNNILHWACFGGDRKTMVFVLSLEGVDVKSRGWGSRTPVMWAAWHGHSDVVELLVSRGADLSLVNDEGDNILHYACKGGDRETVEFVLSLDAVDVNARNDDGRTAADVARLKGHRHLLDLLVSRGTQ